MSPRRQPGLVLPRTPLLFVLAQVRIGPVLAIEDKIPAIQEALRRQGFPRLQKRTLEVSRINATGITQIDQRPQWEFLNRESTLSILIAADSLVLQSSAYTDFETFLAPLQLALSTLAEKAEPSLVERLGLRYVDLILPAEGKTVADYIPATLRGEGRPPFGERKAFLSESVFSTQEASQLIVRFIESQSGFAFPADLLPVSLKFPKDPNRATPFGLLDLDHFAEKLNADFDTSVILHRFWELHHLLDEVFRASTTKAAREEWAQPSSTP